MLRFVGELAGPVLWAGLIHDASGCACAARVRTWTLEVFGRDPAIIQRTLFNAPLQGGDRVLFALADDVLFTEGALGLALADRLRQERVAGLGSGHFEQLNAFASVFESDADGWVSGRLARAHAVREVDAFLALLQK